MSRSSVFILSALLAGAVLAGNAHANEGVTVSNGTQLGTPVQNAAGRTVKVDASTKYINAGHFETLTIQDEKGQSFTWQFDTFYAPANFPLKRIAPAGFQSGNIRVYVEHPRRHMAIE